jgi:hypothetical protein
VLSRYADIIVARVKQHQILEVMAAHSEVPVINGLCDQDHPCQALADFLTLSEYYGRDLSGLTVAWIGDGNNVCRSLVHAATALGVRVRLSSPPGYRLDGKTVAGSNGLATHAASPSEAVAGADAIYTDTWISMGQESEREERLRVFLPYQVNAALMAAAPAHALVMHCLPAKPGYEITAEVLRSPLGGLRPGREPHPRPEGRTGVAGGLEARRPPATAVRLGPPTRNRIEPVHRCRNHLAGRLYDGGKFFLRPHDMVMRPGAATVRKFQENQAQKGEILFGQHFIGGRAGGHILSTGRISIAETLPLADRPGRVGRGGRL